MSEHANFHAAVPSAIVQPTCRASSTCCSESVGDRSIVLLEGIRCSRMVARPLAENRRDGGYELARPCRKRKKVIGLFVHCDSPMRFRRPAGEHDYRYVCRGGLVPHAAKETLVGRAGKVEIGDY